MNIFSLMAVICATFLVGCTPDAVVEIKYADVMVEKIDPPKHYSITFKNLQTGEVINKRISKHCSTYKKIKIGEVYRVEISVRETSEKKRYSEYSNLKHVFCPK